MNLLKWSVFLFLLPIMLAWYACSVAREYAGWWFDDLVDWLFDNSRWKDEL